MYENISSDLWYELKRIEAAWYEIDATKINVSQNERLKKLETLSQLGFVKHWYNGQRHCELYSITDEGMTALKAGFH